MRTSALISMFTIVWALCVSVDLRGQTPGGSPVTEIDERAAYDASGRRDPFLSLNVRGDELPLASGRPPGVRGLLISELSFRGVVRSGSRFLAMVEGPDKRTHTVTPGAQLLDGTVKVVAADAIVFLQQVTDPLSTVTQREIRKTLRPTEENR